MKYSAFSRRHFLQGLSGSTLALPFLPSLMPAAHAANIPGAKYFICMATPHGGLDDANFYPTGATSGSQQLYTGSASAGLDHSMRYGRLRDMRRTDSHVLNPEGIAEISPVLGNFLNPHIDQINILRGLDIMFYIAHHSGGYLGNFHGNDGNDPNQALELPPMPTIDRVMGYASEFYGENDPFRIRTINMTEARSISFGTPGNAEVQMNPAPGYGSSRDIFQAIFGNNSGPSTEVDPRISIIDRVLSDYQRVTSSQFGAGRYISAEDKTRLEEHVANLREIERRISANSLACNVVAPTDENPWRAMDSADRARIWSVYIDVIVAAFQCGASRIATISPSNSADYDGDWHQDIAHQHTGSSQQQELARASRFISQYIFSELVDRLSVEIAPGAGRSYLDDGLIVWNQESGSVTHDADSLPTVTAGSAGGYFNTGWYVDYRNMSNLGLTGDYDHKRPGLPFNRWLYTLLNAFDIPEHVYKTGALANMQGYGDPWNPWINSGQNGHSPWPTRVTNDLNRVLPFIVS